MRLRPWSIGICLAVLTPTAQAAPADSAIVLLRVESYKEVAVDPPPMIDGYFRYRYRVMKVFTGKTSRKFISRIEFGSPHMRGENYYALLDESLPHSKSADDSEIILSLIHISYGFCLGESAAAYMKLPAVEKFQNDHPCH